MHTPRALAVALALTLLLVLAPPAQAGAVAAPTTFVAQGSRKLAMFRDGIDRAVRPAPDQVRYTGRLRTEDGAAVSGASVRLERKLANQDGWTPVSTETTGDDGRVSVRTAVRGNARYRWVFDGDASYAASTSDAVTLKAMRDLNATKVERGGKVFLRGNVNPGWEGRTITWQRKQCRSCAWRTIRAKRTSDLGAWRFRAGYPPIGKRWVFRARVRAADIFVDSVSAKLETRSVRVG